MGTKQKESEMFSDFIAIASRSRHHMAQDALGVGVLFAMLISALYASGL